ncbi:spermidine synthase [Colwelliaceae bacterium MEBiC 14330]
MKKFMRYLLLIFIGAFLLFQVQPLIAKLVLPFYGGGAAVWTACLLFFQAFLLLGYFYAHQLAKIVAIKKQISVHASLLLISLLVLPIGLQPDILAKSTLVRQSPLLSILMQLTLAVGLPYFLLASTGPLVQRWLTFIETDKLPYKLYSLSNFASLLALLSFPFVVEPLLDSSQQSLTWSLVYFVYVLLFLYLMYGVYRQLAGVKLASLLDTKHDDKKMAIAKATLVLWGGLSAIGVVLLVATTNAMTQNIPPVPFLWILPLCLYLLSFIISFHSPKWYERTYWLALFSLTAVLAILMFFIGSQLDIISQVVIYSCILFTACMVCHGELARIKPQAQGLTLFYLIISLGGFLGSAFVAFVAQKLFSQFLEFPLAIVAVFLLIAATCKISPSKVSWLAPASLRGFVVLTGLFIYINQLYIRNDIHSERNFYGILSVKDVAIGDEKERRLIDGTTSHGTQSLQADKRHIPLSYYRKGTGVALSFSQMRRYKTQTLPQASTLNVGFVGLGAGTLAAYGQQGDHFTFYELNPAVIKAAENYFTYLGDSPAAIRLELGDARVSLAQEQSSNTNNLFDLLIVDAFSGDSIPQHLLTSEALSLYLENLTKEGIIVIHVSNSHLNLLPLMRGLAKEKQMAIRYFHTRAEQSEQHDTQWVWLSQNKQLLNSSLVKAYQSDWPDDSHKQVLWTDAHSSLISVLK